MKTKLTDRQLAVLRAMAEGMRTPRDIAEAAFGFGTTKLAVPILRGLEHRGTPLVFEAVDSEYALTREGRQVLRERGEVAR